jgi:hypothetical protein
VLSIRHGYGHHTEPPWFGLGWGLFPPSVN